MNRSTILLTRQQARLFGLRQQHLVQVAPQPLDVVQALIAIQTQYAATPTIALWSRCADMSPNWLDSALHEERTLVKTWCLRGTVHLLTSADLPTIVQAVGRQLLLDHYHFMETRRGLDRRAIDKIGAQVISALSVGPLSRSELHDAVPELRKIPGASWGLDVKALALTGDIVFAGSIGQEARFGRRDRWLAALPWNPSTEEISLRELLGRYLATYGPATMQDFAHWTGLKMKRVKSTFEACRNKLLKAEVAGWPGEHYLRMEDEALLSKTEAELPPVCILPKFDPVLMVYHNKQRYIDRHHLPFVYRSAGQVEAVVLLLGRVAATWRMKTQGTKLTMTVLPFDKLAPTARLAVQEVIERLALFLGMEKLQMLFADT
jgi:hypothetical protein